MLPRTLAEIATPALVVDLDVLEANIAAMAERCRDLGVALRPHIKTHKCHEIGRLQLDAGARGITASTLYEAKSFADAGFDDITWAFPLILSRAGEARELADRVRLGVVVDSHEAVAALANEGHPFRVWIKVDCGYHRAGVDPLSSTAELLAGEIKGAGMDFAGLLSHSGHAYDATHPSAAAAAAEEERACMVELGERLRSASHEVSEISVGSTPSMAQVERLDGVTEARPGNYAFYDMMQVQLGSCGVADCALTVLTSVVSRLRDHAIVDAGALALSKERCSLSSATSGQASTMAELFATHEDYQAGRLHPELRLTSLSQEHGKLSRPLPVGNRLRLLPNHSCPSAAAFPECTVVRGEQVVDRWRIWNGR